MKKYLLPLILILFLIFILIGYCLTYTSQYPPAHNSTYVKATTHNGDPYWEYYATDPTKSLIGVGFDNSWMSQSMVNVRQRFHIDLGSMKVIRRIYYENFHFSGSASGGVKNFTLWGSNTAGSFSDLAYDNDGGWTELTVAQNTFDIHVSADQADPKFISVTNSTAYRYYGFKFADGHGGAQMGVRRIELQTEDLPPDPPTNVDATDGDHTDKVVVTWTKSDGATDYQVYRDDAPLGWLGDVATYDDTGADAPTITVGTASASDGTSPDYVTLSIAGESVTNGTTHTYKVKAKNVAGESGYSGTNTGYRGHGTLTYQWQRSAADSNENYSNIDGATTDPYNDTGAPENGDGRYFKCVENATGAAEQTTNADRGHRIPPVAEVNVLFFSCPF